jgi:hypothetical protein
MMETIRNTADLTYQRWTAEWLHNAADNGRAFGTMPSFLETNAFLKKTAVVICGSGPSLMGDIDDIKRKRDELVVFGNHSNSPTLLYYGIIPDFIVVTDAGEPTELRFVRDILRWRHELRKNHTKVILATTCRPGLAKAVDRAGVDLRWFKSLPKLKSEDARSFEFVFGESMHAMTPQLDVYVLQAGSVSNTTVMIAHTLAYNDKFPAVRRILLSGVDCGYPGGIKRCDIVEWDEGKKDWKVTEKPTAIGSEIKVELFCGYPTDAASIAYRNDLALIAERLANPDKSMVPPPPVIPMFTTSRNFLADFLGVQGI